MKYFIQKQLATVCGYYEGSLKQIYFVLCKRVSLFFLITRKLKFLINYECLGNKIQFNFLEILMTQRRTNRNFFRTNSKFTKNLNIKQTFSNETLSTDNIYYIVSMMYYTQLTPIQLYIAICNESLRIIPEVITYGTDLRGIYFTAEENGGKHCVGFPVQVGFFLLLFTKNRGFRSDLNI